MKFLIVYVYCFVFKGDDEIVFKEICDCIEVEIGMRLRLGKMENEGEVEIMEVRDVVFLKWMFCVSFRILFDVVFVFCK